MLRLLLTSIHPFANILSFVVKKSHSPKNSCPISLYIEVLARRNAKKIKTDLVEFANSADPDETAHYNEPSHLDLHCLAPSF